MSTGETPGGSPGPTPSEAEIAALYRTAANETPSPALDASILKAARTAAANHPAPAGRRRSAWWQRWLLPVSVTAVAVLGVSLSLRVHEEQAALEAARMAGQAPRQEASEALGDKARPAAESPAPGAAQTRADAAKDSAARVDATAPAAATAARVPAAPATRGPAGPASPSARSNISTASGASNASSALSAPPPSITSGAATAPRPAAADAISGSAAKLRRPPAADSESGYAEKKETAAPASKLSSELTDTAAQVAPPGSAGAAGGGRPPPSPVPVSPPAAGRAAPAPVPPPTPVPAAAPAALGEAAPFAESRTRTRESDQPAARPAAAPRKKAAEPAGATPEADAIELNPEKWLAEIRAARRAGRVSEAAVQLERFRQRYPDYPLPADLK